MTSAIRLGAVLALVPFASSGAGLDHLPMVADIAPEAVAISPHVPHMGVHYAHPADLPTGPIWCVINGRVVCVEYMFMADALADGQDWTGLMTGMETPPISHIDLEDKPDGAGPISDPLYQLHVYFVSADILAEH